MIYALITLLVVGITLLLLIGLSLGQLEVEKITSFVGTLFATFLGAWFAFAFESHRSKKEKREQSLEQANKLLYSLYERLNSIKLFQIDHVNPNRDHPMRMVSMAPVLDFNPPNSSFNAQSVSFLFQTKYRHLMLSLNVASEQFDETVKAIRHRSDLHLNVFQPLLEQAGYQTGEAVTDEKVKSIIGDRNYQMLIQATDAVVENVDKFVSRGDELRGHLIDAFSGIFSQREIFSFELLDKPVSNPMQP